MKKVDPFYKTNAWLKCRAIILRRDGYQCQPCKRRKDTTPADTVHHIKERKEFPELALDEENLESICRACHNKEHPEKGGFVHKKQEKKRKKLKIVTVSANVEQI